MSKTGGNMDINKLMKIPPGMWEWPKICGFVPKERNMPYTDYTFKQFVRIMGQTEFIDIGYTEVTTAINQAVHQFLDTDYTHFLMLDADHVHPTNIIQRLAKWVIQDHGVQIVGGVNHRRSFPYEPAVYRNSPTEEIPTRVETVSTTELDEAIEDNKLVEVDSMGAGCLLIAKEVFLNIDPPWWEWDYKNYKRGNCRSPDTYFCVKAKEKGYKVWADPSTCSPHCGIALIDMNIHKAAMKKQWEMMEKEKENAEI